MATAGSRWAIVMSRGAGFSDQVPFVNLCSMKCLWDGGARFSISQIH